MILQTVSDCGVRMTVKVKGGHTRPSPLSSQIGLNESGAIPSVLKAGRKQKLVNL